MKKFSGRKMKKFSRHPDPDMRWIYDSRHPDYKSAMATDLRARRDEAMNSVPQWMWAQAYDNDKQKEVVQNANQDFLLRGKTSPGAELQRTENEQNG